MTTEKLGVEEARQGETSGHVRYILLGSIIGSVVTLGIVSIVFWGV